MSPSLVLPWQTVPQGRVFISYRRDDSQWAAGRLADSLSRYFGDDRVFRDIEGIGGGADFAEVIHGTLGKADAVVVLIGDRWLDALDERGQRRLEDPGDWVAQEIATALEAGIPVYPVLVEDTRMPPAQALPQRLRGLVRLNAIGVSDQRWDTDVARLAKIVSLDIPSASERKLHGANLLISLGLAAAVLITCAALVRNLICHIDQSSPLPPWLFWICSAPYSSHAGSCAGEWPLSLALSGITFLAIVPSSALLFTFARLVDEQRRAYLLAAAWVGALGTLICFVLLKWIDQPYEPITMFFGGTATALLMFALLNLSGFRPK